MPLTDSFVTTARWVKDQLEDNMAPLGLEAVYYGDQNKIPTTPTVCVEPGVKQRELNGAPRRTRLTMQVFLLIYLMRIDSVETTREDVDTVGEDVETFLHSNPQMDGLAVHSMVTQMESGYAIRGNTLFRTCRLTFEVDSQNQLPQGGA